MADSLSIFAEGTFGEQVQEMVKYLARSRETEEDRAAFIRPFQDALNVLEGDTPLAEDEEKRKRVIRLVLAEMQGLGEGNDREIEGFFNLIYAHLFTLYPPDSSDSTQLVTSLINTITSSTLVEQSPVKYRILSNLFNALPNRSTLRSKAYKALLDVATENSELEVLQIKMPDVEKWLDEWDINAEEKSQFLKNISDAFALTGHDEISYTYLVSHVRSISPRSPQAESAALDVLATSLRLPSVFSFEPILKIDTVQIVNSHPIFVLFKIVLEGGLSDFHAWVEKNNTILNQFDLEMAQVERKIRLLVLADLGSRNIGRDVHYSEIAASLHIEVEQVEAWVIDVIRTRLLSGRLSQPNKTLHVTRGTPRSFTKGEWEIVERKLLTWQSGLQGVLEVIAAARKSAATATSAVTRTPVDGIRTSQPQVA